MNTGIFGTFFCDYTMRALHAQGKTANLVHSKNTIYSIGTEKSKEQCLVFM